MSPRSAPIDRVGHCWCSPVCTATRASRRRRGGLDDPWREPMGDVVLASPERIERRSDRNWGREERTDIPGYVALHPVLVPGGTEPPTAGSLLDVTRAMVDEHGYQWAKSAISAGQYTHPDGLYFGGDRTEESNRILAAVVARRLAGADEVLVVDLHTGHGAFGTYTLLSHVLQSHPDDGWLREMFDPTTSSAPKQRMRRPARSTSRSRADSPRCCPRRSLVSRPRTHRVGPPLRLGSRRPRVGTHRSRSRCSTRPERSTAALPAGRRAARSQPVVNDEAGVGCSAAS